MTDEQPQSTDDDPSAKPTGAADRADETFGWTAEEGQPSGQGAGAAAERMLAQLQSMIDTIATQAGPVVKQVGAKAAELAAAAADRAGPIAHKAADATAGASVKIAERSRGFAADLRRDTTSTSNGNSSPSAGEKTTEIATDLRRETASGEGDASGAVEKVLDDVTESGDTV